MSLEQLKVQLTTRTAFLLFTLIFISAIVQPFLEGQPALFTYTGIASTLISGACFLYLYQAPPHSCHPYLLIVMGLAAVVPLVVMSGGVHSHYALVLPIAPVIVCLLTRAAVGWLFAVVLCVFIAVLYVFHDYLPVLTQETPQFNNGFSRTAWLLMACFLGAAFGAEFDRLSRKLGSKLADWDNKDPLTQVQNRLSILDYLSDKVEQAQLEKHWLTVFKIDVDNMRRINAEHGHIVGDACLKHVATCLQTFTRNREDAIGRFGAKDFLVILEEVDQSTAQKIAEKIREGVSAIALADDGQPISLTVTIGYCSLPSDQLHPEVDMVEAAEMALRAGKRAGKDRVVGAEHAIVTQNTLVFRPLSE